MLNEKATTEGSENIHVLIWKLKNTKFNFCSLKNTTIKSNIIKLPFIYLMQGLFIMHDERKLSFQCDKKVFYSMLNI